ncbi:MAG: type IV pilus twitching motility protein PilT [Schwartzia sp. (in: firmicutes)]
MTDRARWQSLMENAVALGASDLHLSVGSPAFFRLDGRLCRGTEDIVTAAFIDQLVEAMFSERQREAFHRKQEIDVAWDFGRQRFRVHVFRQFGGLAMSLRLIPPAIPSFADLGCPPVFQALVKRRHGLILVTGRTGSGKTTTLAAFLGEVNRHRERHIITLEDPIEYVHISDKSLISQRELGTHFTSFSAALRSSLRDDPDILLVGELRDADTIATALNAAETGHLVLASLHTQSAVDTVLRLESFFPAEQQGQIRAQLAIVLCAVITQQLLPAADGGRVAASEVLTASPAVRNLIRQGKVQQLPTHIMAGSASGMQTMHRSIEGLRAAGKITSEVADGYLGS